MLDCIVYCVLCPLANILPYATFEESIETQQRPGLDGSSSDSDDGAITNFARSRIGTAYQQQLSINDHEVQETRPAGCFAFFLF